MKTYQSKNLNRKVTIPVYCAHCDNFLLSDDPEIAEQGLCDSCYREVNDYEIIGWRKGE